MASPSDPPQYAESGPGSIAGFGPRFGAFVIDALLADALAAVILGGYHAGPRQNLVNLLAFLLIELVFVSLAGQTPGMRAFGIAVVPINGRARPAPQWVAVRTLLLATLVPALIPDKTGRWMHDRAAGTVMLHTRGTRATRGTSGRRGTRG